MLIKEVHIDGFGIFHNKHISGLKTGINLLYGPNEFGKTTFLEFIRRILFGFPGKRGGTNQYPAVNGGQYGGRLSCELSTGELIDIHRTSGTHGGSVKLVIGSQEESGQDSLNSYFGSISETFYKNVYAFSLNELEDVDSLKAEEISNRIYGAGLELGGKSLTEIKKTFNNSSDALFKKGGSANELAKILSTINDIESDIRELQKGLSDYEDMRMEKEEIEEEITKAEVELKELNEQKYFLQNLKKLFPNYVRITLAQKDLDETEDAGALPEDALERLVELKRDYDANSQSIDEKQNDLDVLTSQHDSISYNEKLIVKEPQILELQSSITSYSDAKRDSKTVAKDKERLKSEIGEKISSLGSAWTTKKVQEYSTSLTQDDTILTTQERLKETEAKINEVNIKLEQYLDGKSQNYSSKTLVPKFYKNAHLFLAFIGLIGLSLGGFQSNWPLAIISGVIALIALIVGVKLKTNSDLIEVDSVEQRMRDQLTEYQESFSKTSETWAKTLAEIGIDNLSPEGYEKIVPNIESIKTKINSKSSLDERLESMRITIDKVDSIYSQILSEVDESKLGRNTETNITLIINQFNDAKEEKRKQTNLNEQMVELTSRIDGLQKQLTKKGKKIDNQLAAVGAEDLEDLKLKNELLLQQKDLLDTIDDNKKAIQSIVGTDQQYKEFLKRISESSPESVDVEIDANKQRLEELTSQKDEQNKTIGQLQSQLETLANDEDLIKNQTEVEIQKTLLQEKAREWAKAQIALKVFNQAISKYETTRQPDVVNMAQTVFSKITEKNYPSLKMLAENQELVVQNQNGDSKKVDELSRGTIEELYFAMRLGLIDVYEKRAESMPFIMDDTFVNFDDKRRSQAIAALKDFAKERQVIVLTCHSNVQKMFKSSSANIISI
jgi:uncharacterized protein YhaN